MLFGLARFVLRELDDLENERPASRAATSITGLSYPSLVGILEGGELPRANRGSIGAPRAWSELGALINTLAGIINQARPTVPISRRGAHASSGRR